MSYIDNLKLSEEFVQQYIKPNGSNAITAQILQNVLMNIVEAAEHDITNAAGSLQRYMDLFLAVTSNISDGAITTPKVADAAITTPKINNLAVTTDKLGADVTRLLLTEDMRDYLIKKMGEDKQEAAQALFEGQTDNAGLTNFVFGDYSRYEMRKSVVVTLRFNGLQVLADYIPEGWRLESGSYVYEISVEGKNNVPSVMFTYTVAEGEYQGYKVKYNSESGEVGIINPVWYGFVPTNNENDLNSGLIGSLNYSTEDVIIPNATLENNLSTPGYFCVLTKNVASATQIGISVLDYQKAMPNFTSPRKSSVTMDGYYVYFSKNSIGGGASLGNVNLCIKC